MHTPTDIAVTVAAGIVFDPKNSDRIARMDLTRFTRSVGLLFDLLQQRQIDYLLVGGVAMLAYVEGRNTQDIDLVLTTDSLEKLPELTVEDRNPQFVKAMLGGLRVDVLLADTGLFRHVLENCPTIKSFADRKVRCATESGLVALKLYALPSLYRQGQFQKVEIYEQDIAQLLRVAKIDTQAIFASLAPVLPESDLNEIQKIVGEIQQRIAQSQHRFRHD